jgi:glycosyltransferase involved in cell wall biosynthesis
MNIIHFTTALSPQFGGPARSVPSLCLGLARQGHSVNLVHLDFGKSYSEVDLPKHENLHYHAIPVMMSMGLRPVLIPGFRSRLEVLVQEKKDLVFHDNGIWLPYSGLVLQVAERSNARMITSTRGMLEPWAMEYGRIRKFLGWHLYQKKRLAKNDVIHATSAEEALNIRKLGLKTHITVIPTGTVLPDLKPLKKPIRKAKKTALFLSRIHPKKGLINLVKAIGELKPTDWQVIIAGYDEEGHQGEIQNAVNDAGLAEYFSFPGPADDHEKWQLYRSADLFILPSYSENFGLVVAEALAAELPVITTRGTPWKDLVEYNCGWWIEPSSRALVETLKEAFSLEPEKLSEMGKNGRQLIERKYSWPSIAEDMIDVYSWMLDHQGIQPDSII